MKPIDPKFAGLLAALFLNACVTAPIGPTVQVMPGPHKQFAEFQEDQAVCKSFAQQQIGDAQQQLNQQQAVGVIGGVLLGAALGGAVGGGNGAGIGAASGAAAGTAVGTGVAANTQTTLQMQYDTAYSQCMFTKGDQVPGFTPPVVAALPGYGGPDPALVRAIQLELIRLGYADVSPDGAAGPRTRGAISSFESANGLRVDGAPTPQLLSRLRGTTAVAAAPAAPASTWLTPAPAAPAPVANSQ